MIRLLILLVVASQIYAKDFPDDFKFGVATASYQIEGAWNVSGKGENIWDRLVHEHPERIVDRTNGDIACDSYYKTKEDVKLMKDLGIDVYRFSLSWSRILPSGYSNYINPDGIRYYNELIDELLNNGIQPFVTIYHWDLPQPLQEIGGWTNPVLADIFEDYARVVFEFFGDRVKMWITFNEPTETCQSGYGDGYQAPNLKLDGIGTYMCSHTILRAHGKAFRLYDRKFRMKQDGQIGMTVVSPWFEPKTNLPEDIAAADRYIKMAFDWFAHPIYSKDGDYPPIMRQRIDEMSRKENWPRSRLPSFTDSDIAMIRGSYNFLGLNHYSTRLTSHLPDPENITGTMPSYNRDCGAKIEFDPTWPESAADWLRVVPWGIYKMLKYVSKTYNNVPVYITENGFADTGELNDTGRINYMTKYLEQVSKAIKEGCNVKAYMAWSLMDNFEWDSGYTLRFGLWYVDFNDPKRPRTPKHSMQVYKNIIKTHMVNLTTL